jgi:hypothetical protein
MMRLTFSTLAALATLPAFAGQPDLSSPVATVRSYVVATKANDVHAARKCWTIDDGNASGALDVVVGMWVASRRLAAVAEAKLGPDGVKLLGRWNRANCSDRAIDTTLERLGNTNLRERDETARVTIGWQPGDGEATPAFLCIRVPLVLRRVGLDWKLDANVFTGSERAADLFGPDKVWSVWRDEMAVMTELTAALENGQLKDVATFEKEMKARVDELKAKYGRKD